MNTRLSSFRFGRAALALAVFLAVALTAQAADKPKYVFMLIGDGMGLPQRRAAAQFAKKEMLMQSFPAQGITTTHAADRFITGSAASGTAMSCGQKTNIGVVGMDPELRPTKTIAEMAKEKGMKVGIVSSVSIDHATPASFYAHVPARGQYYDIDVALAKSGFDYFGGGGLKDPNNERDNATEYVGNALELAKKNGYQVVTDKDAFMKLKPGKKVLAYNEWLQNSGALPYQIDTREQDISLSEFTKKGIELLDNPNGFFMMVEAGKIDWACHANDGASAIRDTLEFDKAISAAYDFYKKHPDETLVIVTGDHECGGLTLGFAGTKYGSNFELLKHQKVSHQKFADEIIPAFKKGEDRSFEAMKPIITDSFGLQFGTGGASDLQLAQHEIEELEEAFLRTMAGVEIRAKDPRTYLLYGGYDPLTVKITHILDQKAGLAWTSYKHTAVPVATCAVGAGSETFNGFYDNTDIALKTMDLMGFGKAVQFADTEEAKRVAAAK
jgi:alkaline phosphatase